MPGLERVLAVGPPLQLARCVALLGQPGNRMYETHFVGNLLPRPGCAADISRTCRRPSFRAA